MRNPTSSDTIASLLLTLGSPLALLTILLQKEVFTLPYLTPLVHSIWEFFTPPVLRLWPLFSFLAPFLRPVQFVAIVHFLRNRDAKFDFSPPVKWMMGGLACQYVPRVVEAMYTVLRSVREGFDAVGLWGAWVEMCWLVVLGVVEETGWRWDGGVLDKMGAEGVERVDEGQNGRLEKGKAGVDGGEGRTVKS